MSKYTVTERRTQRTTRGGYGASSNRSTFGYWIPLVLTVTAATVGIAAWIWSERDHEEDESSSDEHNPGGVRPPGYASMSGGIQSGPGPGPSDYTGPPHPEWQGGQPPPGGFQGPPGPGMQSGPPPQGGFQDGHQDSREIQSRSTTVAQTEETGLVARMSSALGITRTSSPGQAINWASKGVTAGVAAAGAAVGGAISSLSQGGKEGFDDQERWSEEAEQRDSSRDVKQGLKRQGTADEFYSGAVQLPRSMSVSTQKRRTVAIVVSSVQSGSSDDMEIGHHASILSYLPEYVHPETTRIFVLIYAPNLQAHPLSPAATNRGASQSMASSYSNISTPAVTPGSFDQEGILDQVDPQPIDESTSLLYKTLHNQALALVDKDTMIMPFTSPQGHKHIIKSLQPEIAYLQEGMCGTDGEIVSELSGWVRTCVVVIGDEEGTGGLIDTDDETERRKASGKEHKSDSQAWWKREERTGLGRGVEVVEALKISDDWTRRVNGKD